MSAGAVRPSGVLATYIHTIRYLKPLQVYGRISSWVPRAPRSRPAPPVRARTGRLVLFAPRRKSRTGPFRFRFLNSEREPGGWNDPGIPRLWLYNLHYFDEPEGALIRKWIRENERIEGAGWEPYPTSLRIVNWVKWLLSEGGNPECEASLARQTRHLKLHLEYRLLANHLLANAKALIFSGLFFCGKEAEGWLEAGLRILNREIPEQILPDGAHFERSPMYHSIILEDLLDLVNLARAYPGCVPDRVVENWRETAGRMLGWLLRMCHPDGEISFFNDAAFGIAPPPRELSAYASRLGLRARFEPFSSGYLRLEIGDAVCLFDAAPIGPDYQPGHAHSDTLSFELSSQGRRLIVNSGTSTYEESAQRSSERSTPAHNTIAIDGLDQSELWGAFRCARRARPFDVRFEQLGDCVRAEARHDGYRRLSNPVIHRRSMRLAPGLLEIHDCLEGTGFHKADIYFHLHPEAGRDGIGIPRLDPKFRAAMEHSTWRPEFGRCVPNTAIVGSWSGCCPVEFTSYVPLG